MQFQVTRGEKGKIEIKVDVPKAAFDAAYKNKLEELGKGTTIAGFRLGKAPADVVENHIGLAKVLNETASLLISKHLGEIFKKEDLVPLDSPKIAIESLAPGSPFSFISTFTQRPKMTVGDWKKIKVKKLKAKEITDDDVNESILNIFEAWKNRKSDTEDQKPESTNQKPATKYIYDAHGNKIFLKDDKKKNGGSSSTGAKIDDEFARAIGARDLSHLREIVKRDLEKIVTDQTEAKFEEEIFEEIAKISEVELPDILIDDELNRIIIRFNSQLTQQKKSLEDYLKEQGMTIEAFKAKWRPQAEKNVKASLIMEEIGKAERISVEREEFKTALANVKQDGLSDAQKVDLERYITLSIFQTKTLDLIKKKVIL